MGVIIDVSASIARNYACVWYLIIEGAQSPYQLPRVHKQGRRVSNTVYAAYKMYAEGNVTSGIVHMIKLV